MDSRWCEFSSTHGTRLLLLRLGRVREADFFELLAARMAFRISFGFWSPNSFVTLTPQVPGLSSCFFGFGPFQWHWLLLLSEVNSRFTNGQFTSSDVKGIPSASDMEPACGSDHVLSKSWPRLGRFSQVSGSEPFKVFVVPGLRISLSGSKSGDPFSGKSMDF